MRTTRSCAYYCFCILAIGNPGTLPAQFQQFNQYPTQSIQRAYYEPLTDTQYQRHLQQVASSDPDLFGQVQEPRPRKSNGMSPTSQLPAPRPDSVPPRFPNSIAPFADPPGSDSTLRDSGIAPDVQRSPEPGSLKELFDPGNRAQIPTNVDRQSEDDSSEVERDPASGEPPTDGLSIQSVEAPALRERPDTRPSQISNETSRPPMPVDALPRVNLPPIVDPNQPFTDQQIAPGAFRSLPPPRTVYQPLYQPIPGLKSSPTLDRAPPLAPETDSSPRVGHPLIRQPEPLAPSDIYSSVVCPSRCSSKVCHSYCPNFYFNFQGGWTGLRDLESQSGLGQLMAHNGTGFSLGLGRKNGCNLRTEVNFSLHQNDISGFRSGSTIAALGGELSSFAGMANAYWDLTDVPSRCFKPYVGIGIGFISIDSEIQDSLGRNIVLPGMDNDTSLAYQWMGGVNYKACRNMDFFAEYQFLGADTYRLDTTGLPSSRYSYNTDNVFFGLRWKF